MNHRPEDLSLPEDPSPQRVLALETSGRIGSLAILNRYADGRVQTVGQTLLSADERTAESLLPAMGGLLDRANWPPTSIQLVSVVTGPGSFTGLRMGVTTAKTFAYAADAKLVGIHTLAAIARPLVGGSIQQKGSSPPGDFGQQGSCGRLWAILNAQRQELFVASFEPASPLPPVPTTQVMGISAWLDLLEPGDRVTGPPLEKLASLLPEGVQSAEERWWQPAAVMVGQLGIALAQQGGAVSPMQLTPQYYRQSAAEEKIQ